MRKLAVSTFTAVVLLAFSATSDATGRHLSIQRARTAILRVLPVTILACHHNGTARIRCSVEEEVSEGSWEKWEFGFVVEAVLKGGVVSVSTPDL